MSFTFGPERDHAEPRQAPPEPMAPIVAVIVVVVNLSSVAYIAVQSPRSHLQALLEVLLETSWARVNSWYHFLRKRPTSRTFRPPLKKINRVGLVGSGVLLVHFL